MSESVEVVSRWHSAVNARDIEAALASCAPDVVVGAPEVRARATN